MGTSEMIAFNLCMPWLRPQLKLLADVAYKHHSRCCCPYKAPEMTVAEAGSAAEAQRRRTFNQNLSSERIKVEHAFGQLKRTWASMHETWKMPRNALPQAFRACALLCNWINHQRGKF